MKRVWIIAVLSSLVLFSQGCETLSNSAKNNINSKKTLIEAVKDGDTISVKVFLDKGVDVNAEDKDGMTALMWAVVNDQTEIAKLLIDAGADIYVKNHQGNTASTLAAKGNHIEIFELLKHVGEQKAIDRFLRTGYEHYINGRYRKAIEFYMIALEQFYSTDACYRLGLIFHRDLNDPKSAIWFYQRYLEMDSDTETADEVRSLLKQAETSIWNNKQKEIDEKLKHFELEEKNAKTLVKKHKAQLKIRELKKRIAEAKHKIDFSPRKFNANFLASDLLGKTIILLPVRSSLGGGTSDEIVTKSLNNFFKSSLNESKIITDDELDKYFTAKNRWDDYFAYIAKYSRTGIVKQEDLEEPMQLYAAMEPDFIVDASSDPFMLSTAGFYPQVFNLYIDFQIWDLKTKQKVWGGMCNGETVVPSKDKETSIYQDLADRIAQRIFWEMMNKEPQLDKASRQTPVLSADTNSNTGQRKVANHPGD
jgi:ankyrin repeat protein